MRFATVMVGMVKVGMVKVGMVKVEMVKLATVMLVGVVAAAGCDPAPADRSAGPEQPTASPSSASQTSAPPSSPPRSSSPAPGRTAPVRTAPVRTAPVRTAPLRTAPQAISLAFAGDIHFEGKLRARLDDPTTALAPVAAKLSAADLTVVNLETAIGSGGTSDPGKRYPFRAPPAALTALAAAGVDVATMANNHGMDFGPEALRESLVAATAGRGRPRLDVVGIGVDARAARAPARRTVGGISVAVFGASLADDPTADPTAHWAAGPDAPGIAVVGGGDWLVRAVTAERRRSDLVVVYLHWGIQGESCPAPSQAALARRLADAGADIVVGSHAHRPQGAGFLGNTFVAYGLGNFIWYTHSEPTGLLTVTATRDGVTEASWEPAKIGGDGLPRFAAGAEADRLRRDFASLRACTNLRPRPRQIA